LSLVNYFWRRRKLNR